MAKYKSSLPPDEFKTGDPEITAEFFLEQMGAVIPIVIAVKKKWADGLLVTNEHATVVEETKAIIDTGSLVSCISHDLAKYLQLPAGDKTELITVAPDTPESHIYSQSIIQIKNSNGILFDPPNGLAGASLDKFGIGVILGRDFLAECRLVYDGPKGEFSITTE